MRKKSYRIYIFMCVILVLCVTIYYSKFYKYNENQIETSSTDTTSDIDTSHIDTSDVDTSHIDTSDIDINDIDTPINDKESPISTNGISLQNETDTTSDPLTNETISRETLRQLSAGTIISTAGIESSLLEELFYYEEINHTIKDRILGISYSEDCTVPFEALNYVRVLYFGFDDETHIGELIVNTAIAEDMVVIFRELYEAKYPIEQMVLVDHYNGDDNASMTANNTSSFNYRVVPGSTSLSKHSFGLAIDINPLYNPYIKYKGNEAVILPKEGAAYVDRTLDNPYYIDEDDLSYKVFTKHGFTWGGSWNSLKDYQHFEKILE